MARRRRVKAPRVAVGQGNCKDCEAPNKRPTYAPGPRCATHLRSRKEAQRTTAHDAYVLTTYSITGDEYWALYRLQGGKCYICQRATGARKRLSVDHDHACCSGPASCGKCVRGLLCTTDNKWLGHIRDSVATATRAAEYLTNPPARRAFNEV